MFKFLEKRKDQNQNSDDNIWNKYETYKKRIDEKNSYYLSAQKYFKEILLEIDKYKVNMALLNNNFAIKDNLKESVKLNEIYSIMKETIKITIESHIKVITKIAAKINSFLSNFSKDKENNSLYSEFKQFFNNYQNQLKKHNQIRDKYHESKLDLEKQLIEKFQNKDNIKINDNKNEIPKKNKEKIEENYKKYMESIEATNKMREDYIEKRDKLINYYSTIEEKELKMYYDVLNEYFKTEKDKLINFFSEDKIIKLYESNEKKSYHNEISEMKKKLKNIEKKDKEIKFENKTNINFDKCTEQMNFDNYIDILNLIKSNFSFNMYSDINIEEEKKNYVFRVLIKRLFDNENNLTEEDKNGFIDNLKNPLVHKTFIKVLNKLRTNSSFKRSKDLIQLLGQSFIIILKEAEKNKDFWAAKNCLILSQTFCYEEENENKQKIKIYPYEELKQNTWLSQSSFWLTYCYWMVDEELKKLVDTFDDFKLEDIKEKKDFSPNFKNRISEVIFSQLLPLITNMLDITKDKLKAIEIIETFKRDFIYLKEEKIKSLYDSISNDKNEIEQLKIKYENMKNQEIKEKNEQNKIIVENEVLTNDKDDSNNKLIFVNNNNNINNNMNTINDTDDNKKETDNGDKNLKNNEKTEKKEETDKILIKDEDKKEAGKNEILNEYEIIDGLKEL